MPRTVSIQELKDVLSALSPKAAARIKGRGTNLFTTNILDSYSIVQLVLTLEDRLNIVFDYSDVRQANFRNIGRIRNLLVEKYGCL